MANDTQRERVTGSSATADRTKNFTDQRIFETPLTAIVRGRIVKVKALGNHEDHSPAYLCWDERGQSSIESIDEVTMVDLHNLPPSTAQVTELLRNLKQ